jgi:hypothetical protein
MRCFLPKYDQLNNHFKGDLPNDVEGQDGLHNLLDNMQLHPSMCVLNCLYNLKFNSLLKISNFFQTNLNLMMLPCEPFRLQPWTQCSTSLRLSVDEDGSPFPQRSERSCEIYMFSLDTPPTQPCRESFDAKELYQKLSMEQIF